MDGGSGLLDFIIFTFQSGYIQIFKRTKLNALYTPLHSNLVIFKLIAAACAVCKFVIFTFQSGYIQIILFMKSLALLQALHSNLVIFK